MIWFIYPGDTGFTWGGKVWKVVQNNEWQHSPSQRQMGFPISQRCNPLMWEGSIRAELSSTKWRILTLVAQLKLLH
jgi:hypothetical protein